MNLREALTLQTILSIATLPFLVWWHLPFPLISLVANIIHPPFLMLFLLLSSLIFFATLLGISCTPLVSALTKLTAVWQMLFKLPLPSGWLVLSTASLLPAGGLLIALLARGLPGRLRGVSIALCVCCFGIVSLRNQAATREKITILRRKEAYLLCLPHQDGTLELIDNRYISAAFNTKSLMYYTVIPHILATYGAPRRCLLRRQGKRTAQAQRCLKRAITAP